MIYWQKFWTPVRDLFSMLPYVCKVPGFFSGSYEMKFSDCVIGLTDASLGIFYPLVIASFLGNTGVCQRVIIMTIMSIGSAVRPDHWCCIDPRPHPSDYHYLDRHILHYTPRKRLPSYRWGI